jgi:hypothetical protein
MILAIGSDLFNSPFSKSLKIGPFPEGFPTKRISALFN